MSMAATWSPEERMGHPLPSVPHEEPSNLPPQSYLRQPPFHPSRQQIPAYPLDSPHPPRQYDNPLSQHHFQVQDLQPQDLSLKGLPQQDLQPQSYQPQSYQQQYPPQHYSELSQQNQRHLQFIRDPPQTPISDRSHPQVLHQTFTQHHQTPNQPGNSTQPWPAQHQSVAQDPSSPKSSRSRGASRGRSFSFKSNGSGNKLDTHETPTEKEAKRLQSKADPTLAMTEAEPATVAAMRGGNNLAAIRSIKHKDVFGNLIPEPDWSNPTRSRWERPLDTIRAFESAIDTASNRRSLLLRPGPENMSNWNRRSTFNGNAGGNLENYYNRRNSFRPENTQFEIGPHVLAPRQSFYGDRQHQQGGQNAVMSGGLPPSRLRPSRLMPEHGASSPHIDSREPRMPSDSQDQIVFPLQHKDLSYETVTSAAASGTSDQAGYQTDLTSASDNSSIQLASPDKLAQPAPNGDSGISFHRSSGHPENQLRLPGRSIGAPSRSPLSPPGVEYVLGTGQNQIVSAPRQNAPPPVPVHGVPAAMGSAAKGQAAEPTPAPIMRPGTPPKRGSWLRRKLTKKIGSTVVT